jgi:S-adenosylmethionine hydrolase
MTDRNAIFFLSDFGLRDEFVGVVHAVLHRMNPNISVIDLTHDVPPFAIDVGAGVLERAVDYLGPGVVLAVVDPGVGTTRRPIAIEIETEHGPRFFVGPDNGLLIAAAERRGDITAAYLLTSFVDVGAVTFDGRDRFAPAASYLASGGDPGLRFDAIDPSTLVRLPVHLADASSLGEGGSATAVVRSIDTYGNCALDRPRAALPELGRTVTVESAAGTHLALVVMAFGDLAPQQLGMLVDSSGHVALVVNQGSAASLLEVTRGDALTITG